MKKKTLTISLLVFTNILFSCKDSLSQSQDLSGTSDIRKRIESRDYPSVFQAWGKADNLAGEDPVTTMTRHDLIFTSLSGLKLEWTDNFIGKGVTLKPASIKESLMFKQKLLALNPNIITITEIRYRDAPSNYLPADSPWWMRKDNGDYVYGWEEGKFIRLELRDTAFQSQIAKQAAAIINTGAVDGIMLDWWNEAEYLDARISILKKVRQAIGPDALIIVNSNDRQIPKSAMYVNGLFMECYNSSNPDPSVWEKYRNTLMWAEENLRSPRVNCLETWYQNSREDLNRMRATTTLALTCSDGYCLFSDPNDLPVPDHLHNWYSYWNSELGKPIKKGFKRTDNAWEREFSNGIVIYNPLGNGPVTVTLNKMMTNAGTGEKATTHVIDELDGAILLFK